MSKRHEAAEIVTFLKNNTSINVEKIFKMRILGAPLFLIVTDSSWTMSKLKEEMPIILRGSITQCQRCQVWGHSMGNCQRPVKCSKFAKDHEITPCHHTGELTCANCKGQHRAFSKNCPVFQQKLSQYYTNTSSRQP